MYSFAACAWSVRHAPAKKRRLSTTTGISSDFTSSIGLPTFRDSSCANSSACSSTASAIFKRAVARSCGVVYPHESNALYAALTAASTSLGPDFGAVAISSSLAGLRIGSVPWSAPERSSPPTQLRVSVRAAVAMGAGLLGLKGFLDWCEGHADALGDGGVSDVAARDVDAGAQAGVTRDCGAHAVVGEREHVRQRRVRERVRGGDRHGAGHVRDAV